LQGIFDGLKWEFLSLQVAAGYTAISTVKKQTKQKCLKIPKYSLYNYIKFKKISFICRHLDAMDRNL
jgi:hypothetical protein